MTPTIYKQFATLTDWHSVAPTPDQLSDLVVGLVNPGELGVRDAIINAGKDAAKYTTGPTISETDGPIKLSVARANGWLVKDSNGKEVGVSSGEIFADLRNQDYINAYIAGLPAYLRGWNAMFGDNYLLSAEWTDGGKVPTTWPLYFRDPAQNAALLAGFASKVRATCDSLNVHFYVNCAPYMDVVGKYFGQVVTHAHGVMLEHTLRTGTNPIPPSGAQWGYSSTAVISALQAAGDVGSIALFQWDNGTDTENGFALAIYLLGAKPGFACYNHIANNHAYGKIGDNQSLNAAKILGEPTAEYTTNTDGTVQRKFANGVLKVNPKTVTIAGLKPQGYTITLTTAPAPDPKDLQIAKLTADLATANATILAEHTIIAGLNTQIDTLNGRNALLLEQATRSYACRDKTEATLLGVALVLWQQYGPSVGRVKKKDPGWDAHYALGRQFLAAWKVWQVYSNKLTDAANGIK